VERAIDFAHQVNPDLQFFFTSSLEDHGLEEWYGFLRAQRHGRRTKSVNAA
jgi:Ni2+-binding GTPase involved in maturation of urease and hydrogenase